MPKLEGKVALVTGGNRGIGRGTALRLAADGADVAIIYRKDQREAESVIQEIEQKKRRGVAIRADLAEVREIEPAVNEVVRKLGRLDILVNNAGVEKNAPFWDVTEQDYDAVLNINLKAVFFVTQAMVRHLKDSHHGGRVINISSVHDELSFPHFSHIALVKEASK